MAFSKPYSHSRFGARSTTLKQYFYSPLYNTLPHPVNTQVNTDFSCAAPHPVCMEFVISLLQILIQPHLNYLLPPYTHPHHHIAYRDPVGKYRLLVCGTTPCMLGGCGCKSILDVIKEKTGVFIISLYNPNISLYNIITMI